MRRQWRAVPGYVGAYEVSNDGLVRSVSRILCDGRFWRGRILKPRPDRQGYLEVNLNQDSVTSMRKVHRLVLETFVGECPDDMECRHLDGDAANNWLTNLCWGTSAENKSDMVGHGTVNRGNKNGNAKICDLDVWLIRNCDLSVKQLADFFDMSKSHISKVKSGVLWSHI